MYVVNVVCDNQCCVMCSVLMLPQCVEHVCDAVVQIECGMKGLAGQQRRELVEQLLVLECIR